MKYISFTLIVFFFVGVTVAEQSWNINDNGKDENLDNFVDIARFITQKRAINGQLRRSSIRWGKRTPAFRNYEKDISLIPEELMTMWPVSSSALNEDSMEKELMNGNEYETTSPSSQTSKSFGIGHPKKEVENYRMERVAKAAIRPKLQLSSRLWGR